MNNDSKKFEKIECIIFDADGVITSEEEYWVAAEHVVLEILFSDQFIGLRNEALRTVLHKPGSAVKLNRFVSDTFIGGIKNAGIGNNWDLTFFSIALYLIDLLSLPDTRILHDRINEDGITTEVLRDLGKAVRPVRRDAEPIDRFSESFFEFARTFKPDKPFDPRDTMPFEKGRHLEEALLGWQRRQTGIVPSLFVRGGPFWNFCRDLFQEVFLGDYLCEEEGSPRVSEIPKDGIIQFERPLLPLPRIIDVLTMLHEARILLGIGTGRPYRELMMPLTRWGIEHLFDSRHIATYREVANAESILRSRGLTRSLSKPNPYIFLRAIFPEKTDDEILDIDLPIENFEKILIVGDAPADLIAARAIGCRTAAVLSGIPSLEAVDLMRRLEPDFVLKDITELKQLI